MERKFLTISLAAIMVGLLGACTRDNESTDEPQTKSPVLSGKFSVAADSTVHFATGNLVCTTGADSTLSYGFEPNQYSFHCTYSETYYDSSIEPVAPDDIEKTFPGLKYEEGRCGHFQWSKDLGSLVKGDIEWRVLTFAEFCYLIGWDEAQWMCTDEAGRANATSLAKWSTVNGVAGLLLAPDDYDFTANPLLDEYSASSTPTWEYAESNYGLVFLPSTGATYQDDGVLFIGQFGYYWAADPDPLYSQYACMLEFCDSYFKGNYYRKENALSVRLVCD